MSRIPTVTAMKVSRARILRNGLLCRCPNCGQRTLFERGRLFKVNASCPNCGMKIERGDGEFLGPFVLNYGVTAFGIIIPVILLYAAGRLGAAAALSLAFAAGLLAPLLLYRLSWGWWLALYYFFLPGNLPGNLGGRPEDDV
jgi:uncharacterized protein (DUF983 family)